MNLFGSKREEVAGDWRKLYNEEPRYSYYWPNIRLLKLRRLAGHVVRIKIGKCFKILVGKPEGKRLLETPGF
jgi:hypothetical protein